MSSDPDQIATVFDQMLGVLMTMHSAHMTTCRAVQGLNRKAELRLIYCYGLSQFLDALGTHAAFWSGMQMEYELWQAYRKPMRKILQSREAA